MSLGPSSRDREARERAILDAALALFSAEGYASVSTRRIAEEAGCSETLVFRYFGEKRGLLLAIAENEFTRVPAGTRPTARDSAGLADYIEREILFICDLFVSRASALRVLMAEIVTDSTLAAEFERVHFESIATVAAEIAEFKRRGAIAEQFDESAVAAGIQATSFTLGFVTEVIYRRPRDEIVAAARSMAIALSLGLRNDAPTVAVPEAVRLDAIAAVQNATEHLGTVLAALDGWRSANGDVTARGPVARRKR